MRRIDATERDLGSVRAILSQHVPDREIRVFGSRVAGTAKPHSDLDIAVMGDEPLPIMAMAELREALDDSDLPFKVDVVEWARVGESFRRIIEQNGVALPLAPS